MKISPSEFKRKNRYLPADDLIKGDTILCPHCKKEEANCIQIGTYYSVVQGDKCKEIMRKKYKEVKLGGLPEFTTEKIKNQRKEYWKSMVQPEREGILSKEFVELHPEKCKNIPSERLKKAEYVFRDFAGWETRHQSK